MSSLLFPDPAILATTPTAAAGRSRRIHLPTFAADLLFVLSVAAVAFAVLGYHPYAEDGGIYAAALAARLDPTLFAHDRAWVTGHTQYSLFVPATVAVLRLLHLRLPIGLLLLQATSLVATSAALLRLARLCFRSDEIARGATLLVMLAAGLPIAGTALYLIDPYATARSLTTPLLLLAAAACLRRQRWSAFTLWLVALALHPMMAAWGALPLAAYLLLDRDAPGRTRRLGFFAVLLLLGCGLVYTAAPPADQLTLELAATRAYWFPARWDWYELLGAWLPTLLLIGALRVRGKILESTAIWTPTARILAQSTVVAALLAFTLALLFARPDAHSMVIARLQPLRTLHMFYAVFLLLFGGTVLSLVQRVGEAKQRGRLLTALLALSLATAMPLVLMQRTLYDASGYFEWPGSPPLNPWEQAFAWARLHTGTDDLFALDAAYTTAPGENAQGFRAIALRSALPDRAKDGGIAAVMPRLASDWKTGSEAQTGLDTATDIARRQRLLPLGVTWLVLPDASQTDLPCPYRNAAVKVCKLR